MKKEEIYDFTWGKYSEMAWATNHRKESNLENFSYGLLGLVGELGELMSSTSEIDKDATVKEAGDVLWYCNFICKMVGIKIESPIIFINIDPETSEMHLKTLVKSAWILEKAKKELFHRGNEVGCLKDDIYEFLRSVIMPFLYQILKSLSVTVEEAAMANIDKLYTRYPNGEYSDKNFEDRVDVK